MLDIKMTENLLGFTISGSHDDIEEVYDAIYKVIIGTFEFESGYTYIDRTYGILYDLRKAYTGNREMKLVENSVDNVLCEYHGMIFPKYDVVYQVNVLYPELVFLLTGLDAICDSYLLHNHKDIPKYGFNDYGYDKDFVVVRNFYTRVLNAIKDHVSSSQFKQIIKHLRIGCYSSVSFIHQYIDMENIKFIHMTKEQRQKKLHLQFKRFVDPIMEYYQVENDIREAAKRYNCKRWEIEYVGSSDYPEIKEW